MIIATNKMDANQVNPVFVFSLYRQPTPSWFGRIKNIASVLRLEKNKVSTPLMIKSPSVRLDSNYQKGGD